jgi:hypothetical protein
VPVRLLSVAYAAHDPARVAAFWAGLLGRQVVEDAGGALVADGETQWRPPRRNAVATVRCCSSTLTLVRWTCIRLSPLFSIRLAKNLMLS